MSSSQVESSCPVSPKYPATTTFDKLDELFVEGAVVVQDCRITGHKQAYRVLSANRENHGDFHKYFLNVQFLGVVWRTSCDAIHESRHCLVGDRRVQKTTKPLFFRVDRFRGVRDIHTLPVYPINYDPSAETLRRELIARGRKWVEICQGMQRVRFTGLQTRLTFEFYPTPCDDITRNCVSVNGSDVVLDIGGYFMMNPHARVFLGMHIQAREQADTQEEEHDSILGHEIPESMLLLAPTFVYGYSLSERRWMTYDVDGDFQAHTTQPRFCVNNDASQAGSQDASLFDVIQTHVRINAISKDVTGDDGQGLFLNLFGFSARTKAEDIAHGYCEMQKRSDKEQGRPRYTFYVSQLTAGSSDLEVLQKVVARTNAVVTIHQDKARVADFHKIWATLPEQVMSALLGENRKCVVLLVSSKRMDVAQEQALHAHSNFSVHCFGFDEWSTLGWWIMSYYWVIFWIRSMLHILARRVLGMVASKS